MFSGIIELVAKITKTGSLPGGRRLQVRFGPGAAEIALGASVCVSGVCLTVVKNISPHLEFDVVRETLSKTTLGQKRTGDEVNLERSLRIGDRLDGHFVQGHVDGTAEVIDVRSSPREHVLWLKPQNSMMAYIVPKGSVTLDGVSLTVAELRDAAFSVALIPATLKNTTLSSLGVTDVVNVETDLIVRAVVHQLRHTVDSDALPMPSLREAGFA